MRRIAPLLTLVAASSTMLWSCQSAGDGGAEMEMAMGMDEVRMGIDQMNAKFVEAFNSGDAADLAALFADDATRLPPDGTILKGRAAIEARRAEDMAEMPGGELSVTTLDVQFSGDMAYEIGTWSVTGMAPDGEDVMMNGTYLAVFKRTAEGTLVLQADTWSVEEVEVDEAM